MTSRSAFTVLLWSVGLQATQALAAGSSDDALAKVDQMHRELNGTCSYPVLEAYRENREVLCLVEALRKRCNKIDDCHVYCIGQGVGQSIGGGCAHLCNYGLKEDWRLPDGAQACLKN